MKKGMLANLHDEAHFLLTHNYFKKQEASQHLHVSEYAPTDNVSVTIREYIQYTWLASSLARPVPKRLAMRD